MAVADPCCPEPQLRIRVDQVGYTSLLSLAGEIDDSSVSNLAVVIERLLVECHTHELILDVEKVTFAGEAFQTEIELARQWVPVTLRGASPFPRRLLTACDDAFAVS